MTKSLIWASRPRCYVEPYNWLLMPMVLMAAGDFFRLLGLRLAA